MFIASAVAATFLPHIFKTMEWHQECLLAGELERAKEYERIIADACDSALQILESEK